MINDQEKDWIELWAEGAPGARGNLAEDKPALQAFPVAGEGRGAVIVCPGGGYTLRAQHEGEPIALWLNSLGINAFVLRYRVAPYLYPSALNDVKRAVRFVRYHSQEYGINSDQVGVLGFSAGGHLTASIGTHFDYGQPNANDAIERQSCRPDAIVLSYPVITMKPPYCHSGSVKNLLGDHPDPELIEYMSCEAQVTSETPPAFLWHTTDDAAVPVENSMQFAMALRRAGVPFDLHVYETGRHGLGLAEEDPHVASWTTVCGHWLIRHQF